MNNNLMTRKELENLLIELEPGVKIELEKTPTGKLMVNKNPTKKELVEEKFADLVGQLITLSEAAKKFNMPRGTLEGWYYKGYITIAEESYPAKFDEAEIAYCVEIYNERKATGIGFYGAPLLDENGLPYELKHEALAKYRKRRRTK